MNSKEVPQLNEEWIHPDAMEIVHALQRRGHLAYLVGGCVRDLLLGKSPKDFDIVTSARPQEVRSCIRNAYIIGKRFRLVLAKRGEDLFEIATFRRDPRAEEISEELPPGDNLFGTPEEDAFRRDFTINALFYDPMSHKIIDFTKGSEDLLCGVIRMIGDPMKRLEEDPIRILRAIRLSHMIRFAMEPRLREGIQKLSHLLPTTALPRRREEILKFLRLEDPSLAFLTSQDLNVLKHMLPPIQQLIDQGNASDFLRMLSQSGISEQPTPTELFARLLTAYLRSLPEFSFNEKELRKLDLASNHPLVQLMRDHLGMFKSEQILYLKALRLIPNLSRRAEFERKGAARVKALVQVEAFPLALRIAEHDFLLNAEDLFFWQNSLALREDDSIQAAKGKKKRRRRRPRRKKPAPAPTE